MENPGAITFVDRLLLMDPAASSVSQKERLSSVIAHELSHMWFGDLVTMEWWDDLWLNESFASWMGTKVMDEVYPEFRSGLGSFGGRRRAMTTDARLSTRAIRQPVSAARNLNQLADELAYSKGQAVLRMFERYLGSEPFRQGVLLYLDTFEWGNANGTDLWDALSSASKTKVNQVMPTFLDQPGLPLVTVRPLSGGRVRLSQGRFLNFGAAAPAPQLWKIPVVLKYGEGAVVRTQSVMLTKAEQDVKLEFGSTMEWIHPNADEAGYYRWSLPPVQLQALASHGRKAMTPGERIGFLDNLSALLNAGEIHADAYLAALGAFSDDPEPEVIQAIADALERVRNVFVDDAMRAAYAAYVRRTLGPALDRIGAEPRAGEPENVPPLRAQLLVALADDGADEALLGRMEALAREYLADPASVPADLRDPVVTLGALRGDSTRFEAYRQRFESATAPADRARYLGALARFRDPALLDRALRYSLEGPLRPQELFTVPFGATDTEARRDRVFRHFTENYDAIMSRVPPPYRGTLPRIADGCSAERLEAARRFFAEPAHQGSGWERQFAKTAESVNDCVGLRARELETVKRYFGGLSATP
jgi:alanyl aminopeptidase